MIGALPPIVQQIPCNLRPQRRVSASQLRREHCRIHCQTNINKLMFTLASSCPSWQSYFIWVLWTKPMPSHLWFSVSGEQWCGQVFVQDSHVILFQSTPACPITKGDTTFNLYIICKIQNICGCVQSFEMWIEKNISTCHSLSCSGTKTQRLHKQCVQSVPDELIIVEEGCVFDQAEALFHSVHKRLDL